LGNVKRGEGDKSVVQGQATAILFVESWKTLGNLWMQKTCFKLLWRKKLWIPDTKREGEPAWGAGHVLTIGITVLLKPEVFIRYGREAGEERKRCGEQEQKP
jgi:hypothetical protein